MQILRPGKDGKFKPYITVGSGITGQNRVQLIHNKKSEHTLKGHYDVMVNGTPEAGQEPGEGLPLACFS